MTQVALSADTANTTGSSGITELPVVFVYEKENLNLIPLDLVGIQMQRKAAATGGVNGGVLRLVRVVHHTILAVFDVGVHLHVVVGAEPCMQLFLTVGAPQDSTVQGLSLIHI